LFDAVVSRGSFEEKECAQLIHQVLQSLEYLHSQGIAHRDLKPENLLIASNGQDSLDIKLSDFGLSKIFNENSVLKTQCGTPAYVAPEILRKGRYTAKVDLWALGVIAFILLSGYPPFYDENTCELYKKIIRGKYQFESPFWDKISSQGKIKLSKPRISLINY
jgi:calcium/calmodulin-dependent protein kinase I